MTRCHVRKTLEFISCNPSLRQYCLSQIYLMRAVQRMLTNFELPEYTGCPRRNVPDFRRVILMLKYTDITQNTYVQS